VVCTAASTNVASLVTRCDGPEPKRSSVADSNYESDLFRDDVPPVKIAMSGALPYDAHRNPRRLDGDRGDEVPRMLSRRAWPWPRPRLSSAIDQQRLPDAMTFLQQRHESCTAEILES